MSLFQPNIKKHIKNNDLPELILALSHKNENVNQAAIKALVSAGESAVYPLCNSLKTENEKLRLNAIIALHQIGDKRSIDPLLSFMDSSDWRVSAKAIDVAILALGKIGDKKSLPLLLKILNDINAEFTPICASQIC